MSQVVVRKARSAVRLVNHRGSRAWRRLVNLSMKKQRFFASRMARGSRIARERVKNARLTAANVSLKAWRRFLALRKPFVRAHKRSVRAGETFSSRLGDWRVERAIDRVGRASGPILVGPWLSEVGFEVLYWIPFLQWMQGHYNMDPARLVAVSRGGAASWYEHLASRYVEVFSILPPDVFAARSLERRKEGEGSHKQLGRSGMDEEILAVARRQLGLERAEVLHPSLMYSLFRQFWLGHRPPEFLERRVRFATRRVAPRFDLSGLPAEYVAVKLYTAASLPDTPENRAILPALVRRLAERVPVVLLDTGLKVDDHGDYGLDFGPGVTSLAGRLTPENNLGLQTEVIGRAKAFVGTCGSLTWLAPFLGVDTVALFSDTRFLHPHLYVARKAYLEAGAARFATLDVSALRTLGLGLLDGELAPSLATR